jgi:hypothetical protein
MLINISQRYLKNIISYGQTDGHVKTLVSIQNFEVQKSNDNVFLEQR